jgi:hypothetical protein
MWEFLHREIIPNVRWLDLPAVALFLAGVVWCIQHGTTNPEDDRDD